ncbi:MAG TPA: alpha/beta fold hydrolase [Pirellulales bacterium]|nr:alpha/beta fold hydrolase [Pirellulales bacterium]
MIVDLVQVAATDGLRLDGALHAPPANLPAEVGVDAVLCLHGTGGNFYSSSLFASLAPRFLKLGAAVLTVNTRGHDLVNTGAGRGDRRPQGAACELVDECRLDLAAWVGWLVERGYRRIALAGHSLGAVKAIYALAHDEHHALQAVVGLMAISPPRLSYSHFRQGPKAAEFQAELAAAEQLVREGRGETLMSVHFPLPYLISAAGYVDKYGPAERYNLLNFAPRVACPALYTFGTLELQHNPAFQGLPELLEAQAAQGANLKVAAIIGADHFYSGVHSELADRLEFWLRRTLPT